MGCGTTAVKISSIIFNIILVLLGIALIIGIAVTDNDYESTLVIGVYIFGALCILFGILGAFAAIRESVCLTATCAVFLLLIAVLQIAATCYGLDENASQNGVAEVNRAWDTNKMNALQKEYECCGKSSAQDYVLLSKPVPPSCYVDENAADPKGLYIDGCSGKVSDSYETQALYTNIASWIMIGFEILGFLLAVFLVINFRNKQRRMQF